MKPEQIDEAASEVKKATNEPYEHIEDLEVVATVVSLARRAPPRTRARRILEQTRKNHPDIPAERVRTAIRQAADLLLAQHHD